MDSTALTAECRDLFRSIQQPRGDAFNQLYRKSDRPHVPHWRRDQRIYIDTDGRIVSYIRAAKLGEEKFRLLQESELDFSKVAAEVEVVRAQRQMFSQAVWCNALSRTASFGEKECGVIKRLFPSVQCGLETALALCIAGGTSWQSLLTSHAYGQSIDGGRDWRMYFENIGIPVLPPNPAMLPPKFSNLAHRREFCANCAEHVAMTKVHQHLKCHQRLMSIEPQSDSE